MKYYIRVFDVVTSPYRDLTGKLKTNPDGTIQAGLFLVLRVDKGNLLCAKITSQLTSFVNNYVYTLEKSSHNFLCANSYIQLDRINMLSVHTVNKVGEIADFCKEGIRNKFKLLSDSILSDLYVPPNTFNTLLPNSKFVEGVDYDEELKQYYPHINRRRKSY